MCPKILEQLAEWTIHRIGFRTNVPHLLSMCLVAVGLSVPYCLYWSYVCVSTVSMNVQGLRWLEEIDGQYTLLGE